MKRHTTRPPDRYVSVCVSMTREDLAKLDARAKRLGLNRSEAVRAMIENRKKK